MKALFQTAERTSAVSQKNNYVFQRHFFAYKEAVKHLGNVVAELGCGSGYGINLLATHCSWYVGVDKQLPRFNCLPYNSAFFRSSLPALTNIGNHSFDTVVCFQVIEHIKEDQQMISEIYRILKPKGNLLLTTPNKSMSLTRNPYHVREYTALALQQLVATTFANYHVMGIYGNNTVMEYYWSNKQSIDKFKSIDIFNLQYLLPATLLKIPYNLANNINRLLLYQQGRNTCTGINWDDYYLDHVGESCLDFFVVAEKE